MYDDMLRDRYDRPEARLADLDQLRAIARNGGVVNVNFFSRFIDPQYLRNWQGADAAHRARGADPAGPTRQPTADRERPHRW